MAGAETAKPVVILSRISQKMEVFRLSLVLFALFTIILMLQTTIVETQRSSPCHRTCKYVEVFQQANCENRRLRAIPMECNAASYLSLRYNQITKIEPGIFRGFPFLKYLILSNNSISHIEANTFIGAPQLKSIKLVYNNLQTFHRNALNGTENRLRNIYLSRNSLRVIENGTFQVVSRLEVIDLQSNQLTHLTSDVFKDLKHLERLFLGMNKLFYLPDNIFKDLTSLVYLDLSNNSLLSLSPDLFVHLDQLRTVDASGNKLVNIGNILGLPNIRLDLRWNRLDKLGHVSLNILDNNVKILFLEGNPWYCDCSVEPLRLWYQQLAISSNEDIKTDNPVCYGPQELVNYTIHSLNVSLCRDIAATGKEESALDESHSDVTSTMEPKYQNVIYRSKTSKVDGKVMVIILVAVVVFVLLVAFVVTVSIFRKCKGQSEKKKNSNANNDTKITEPKEGEDETVVSLNETTICEHEQREKNWIWYWVRLMIDFISSPFRSNRPTDQKSTPSKLPTSSPPESPFAKSTPICKEREKDVSSSVIKRKPGVKNSTPEREKTKEGNSCKIKKKLF